MESYWDGMKKVNGDKLMIMELHKKGNVIKSRRGPTFIANQIDFGIDTLQLILTLFSPFCGISSPKTSICNDFCLKSMPDRLERACLDGDKAPLFHFFPPLSVNMYM